MNEMKVLYINPAEGMRNGGDRVLQRNLSMCKIIVGENNVFYYTAVEAGVARIKRHIRHFLWGYYFDMTPSKRREIMCTIGEKGIGVVFLDGSRFGKLAKDIKKQYPQVRIITFFHNLETDLSEALIKLTSWPRKLLFYYSYSISSITERLACQYSDVIIALNQRDSDAIQVRYDREPDFIVPVSLKDEFDSKYLHSIEDEQFIGLMVGSYFPPNIEGLDWFVNNVFPNVNIRLIVAGNKMDRLRDKYKDIPNIEIHGYIDNLNELYAKADFIVIPVFDGSGMKVKTAEAFEYGKFVIAGPEAMTGYEYSSKEAVVCKTAQDFIDAISAFKRPEKWNGFLVSSRNLFLSNYSYNHSLEIFKRAFEM